jgi:hypothetical protein
VFRRVVATVRAILLRPGRPLVVANGGVCPRDLPGVAVVRPGRTLASWGRGDLGARLSARFRVVRVDDDFPGPGGFTRVPAAAPAVLLPSPACLTVRPDVGAWAVRPFEMYSGLLTGRTPTTTAY